MDDAYTTLAADGEAQLREKASRFLGLAFPIADEAAFKERCAVIAKTHFDARHVCWAWVLGERGERTRSNDDGEPAGTAGAPMLRHLQGAGVTHAAVVVVRWFGGTLLGKGGLIRAYGGTAQAAIAAAPQRVQPLLAELRVVCAYDRLDRVKRDIALHGGHLVHADYTAFCELVVAVARSAVSSLIAQWALDAIRAEPLQGK